MCRRRAARRQVPAAAGAARRCRPCRRRPRPHRWWSRPILRSDAGSGSGSMVPPPAGLPAVPCGSPCGEAGSMANQAAGLPTGAVVVGVDGSTAARRAVDWATSYALAHRTDGATSRPLVVVYATGRPDTGGSVPAPTSPVAVRMLVDNRRHGMVALDRATARIRRLVGAAGLPARDSPSTPTIAAAQPPRGPARPGRERPPRRGRRPRQQRRRPAAGRLGQLRCRGPGGLPRRGGAGRGPRRTPSVGRRGRGHGPRCRPPRARRAGAGARLPRGRGPRPPAGDARRPADLGPRDRRSRRTARRPAQVEREVPRRRRQPRARRRHPRHGTAARGAAEAALVVVGRGAPRHARPGHPGTGALAAVVAEQSPVPVAVVPAGQ